MLGFVNVPILRRVAFHAKRIGAQVDRHFFTTLLTAVVGFVAVATLLVTLFEEKFTVAGIGSHAVLGGDHRHRLRRSELRHRAGRLHRRRGCSHSSAWPSWRP